MISQADVDLFRKQGYLVVEGLLDEDALSDIRAEYAGRMDALYDQWHREGKVPAPTADMGHWDKFDIAFKGGFDWYQPFDISLPHADITDETPMHFGPAVFNMVRHKNILDTVEKLIGPEITSNPIQHVRIKPPARELSTGEVRAHVGGTDWHQDRAVALEDADETDMVTVWVAVSDATVENGCLQVAPRLAEEILPHCPKSQTAIADGFVDKAAGVPLPVRSGGILLLDPMLPHASLANHSDHIRWSFDLRYSRTGQPTGRGHFPEFVARSRARPDTELHDWRAWRAMWEEARARLSAAPHVDIHRWSSDAPVCA